MVLYGFRDQCGERKGDDRILQLLVVMLLLVIGQAEGQQVIVRVQWNVSQADFGGLE